MDYDGYTCSWEKRFGLVGFGRIVKTAGVAGTVQVCFVRKLGIVHTAVVVPAMVHTVLAPSAAIHWDWQQLLPSLPSL